MSQDEYFLALAQMFTQGQARAAESSRMVAADLREQARYEDEKPFREARLAEAITAGKRAEIGLKADEFQLNQAEEQAPFNFARARDGARLMAEQLKSAERENEPIVATAKIRSTVANSLFEETRAEAERLKAEKLPAALARDEQESILRLAIAGDDAKLKKLSLDELVSGKESRAKIQDAAVKKAENDVASLMTPEEIATARKVASFADQIKLLGAMDDLENGKNASLSQSIENLRRLDLIRKDRFAAFYSSAEEMLKMSVLAEQGGDKAKAEKFRAAGSEFLATIEVLAKQDPAFANLMEEATAEATRNYQRSADRKGLTTAQRLDDLSNILRKASDGNFMRLVSPDVPPGAASRPDSRPGDAALGGMLKGGDTAPSANPQAPKPKNALESMMADEAAAKRKKEFDALQSELAGNEATRAKWTRSAEAVWNEMSPSERKAMAVYFDVGQAAPQNQNDVIRLMGGQLQALSQGDEAALRRGGAGAAKELLLKRVKASR